MNKTLKSILADTPLVRNLKNEEYLEIILNGCSTLAERFSLIDDKIVREQLRNAENNHEKISREAKWIIKQPDLPGKISALFLGDSKINANWHLRTWLQILSIEYRFYEINIMNNLRSKK